MAPAQYPDCLRAEGRLCPLCVCELGKSLGIVASALGDCCEDGMIVPARHLAHYHSKCPFPFPFRGMKTEEWKGIEQRWGMSSPKDI